MKFVPVLWELRHIGVSKCAIVTKARPVMYPACSRFRKLENRNDKTIVVPFSHVKDGKVVSETSSQMDVSFLQGWDDQ